jgi:hypothetical protein
MASWTLTGDNAFPIFASPNYLCQDAIDYGTFTAAEMSALIKRVIDGDPNSYWQQSSAGSDGSEVIVGPFSFNRGSSLIARSPDLIVLQNINWKNFVGQWSTDGITWSTIASLNYASGVANNSAANLIVNPSDIASAKYLRFKPTDTITANAKKKVGGIIACLGVVQPSSGFLDYKVKNRESVREVVLGDGTVSREYIMRSAASYEFWGSTLTLPFVTTAELALLRTIKRGGDPFIVIPEPADAPGDAFQCHFDGPWAHEYENPVRSIGYSVPLKLKEAGSH